MTTITAPSALIPLNAPIPSPRRFTLLDTVNVIEPGTDNGRWLGGANTGGDPPGPAHTHDPCSSGTDRVKAGSGEAPIQMSGRFSVYKTGFCTAQGIGPNPQWYTDRMKLWFQVLEPAAVERALATGDGMDTMGHYLGDLNMAVLSGGGAVSASRGLQLLETEIASHGNGVIHATPAVATAWSEATLIAPDSSGGVRVMRTTLGTPVVIGAGYIDANPAVGPDAGSDQEWAFASNPVNIYRGNEIEIVPFDYFEAIDRSMNDVLFIAERPYLFSWIARETPSDDGQIQAGVLIDLVP